MMTPEAVRNALRAADPFAGMDRLVRAEMAAGRKVRDIYRTLFPLWEGIRAEPLTEDQEEAVLGTLDALSENCHRDQWYEDPPDTSLPTEAELAQLPRWARVAFAARCARRIVCLSPAATDPIHPISGFHGQTLCGSLRLTELAATTAIFLAREGVIEVDELLRGFRKVGGPLIQGVALAVAHAAHVAFEPDDCLHSGSTSVMIAVLDVANTYRIERDIRRDFDHLLRIAEYRGWDDDTPVPPDVFGPLWPEGAPAGWPADPDLPHRDELAVTAAVRDGVPDRHVVDELLNVFNAVNRYFIARTGRRLTLEGDLPYLVAALVPEGSAT